MIAHTRLPGPGSIGSLLPAVSPSPAAFAPSPGEHTARGQVASVTAATALPGNRAPGTLIFLTVAFAVALAGSAARLELSRRARRRRAR